MLTVPEFDALLRSLPPASCFPPTFDRGKRTAQDWLYPPLARLALIIDAITIDDVQNYGARYVDTCCSDLAALDDEMPGPGRPPTGSIFWAYEYGQWKFWDERQGLEKAARNGYLSLENETWARMCDLGAYFDLGYQHAKAGV